MHVYVSACVCLCLRFVCVFVFVFVGFAFCLVHACIHQYAATHIQHCVSAYHFFFVGWAIDQLVFDLDAGEGTTFAQMVKVASAIRRVVEGHLKLKTFVMLTGSKGLHIVCPLRPPETAFEVTHDLAKGVAFYVELIMPQDATTNSHLAARKGT